MARTRGQRTNAALAEIAGERERQVNVEGWSESHDDGALGHDDGALAQAAACYAVPEGLYWIPGLLKPVDQGVLREALWPEEWGDPKPKSRRRNLIRAAALIVAELERLDRLAGD